MISPREEYEKIELTEEEIKEALFEGKKKKYFKEKHKNHWLDDPDKNTTKENKRVENA